MKCGFQLVLLVAAMILPPGCNNIAKQLGYVPENTVPSNQQKLNSYASPIYRFVLAPGNAKVAFDTQTGQLCVTCDWAPLAPEAKSKNVAIPQRIPRELAPTCITVFAQYPTRGNSREQDGTTPDSSER
jgi:hypothetical protein